MCSRRAPVPGRPVSSPIITRPRPPVPTLSERVSVLRVLVDTCPAGFRWEKVFALRTDANALASQRRDRRIDPSTGTVYSLSQDACFLSTEVADRLVHLRCDRQSTVRLSVSTFEDAKNVVAPESAAK